MFFSQCKPTFAPNFFIKCCVSTNNRFQAQLRSLGGLCYFKRIQMAPRKIVGLPSFFWQILGNVSEYELLPLASYLISSFHHCFVKSAFMRVFCKIFEQIEVSQQSLWCLWSYPCNSKNSTNSEKKLELSQNF